MSTKFFTQPFFYVILRQFVKNLTYKNQSHLLLVLQRNTTKNSMLDKYLLEFLFSFEGLSSGSLKLQSGPISHFANSELLRSSSGEIL